MSELGELLELAAKAAGITVLRSRLENPICADLLLAERTEDGHAIGWNPLTDDGDALRLAVKLGLTVGQFTEGDTPFAFVGHLTRPYEEGSSDGSDDAMAATRMVIVDAAAEIGKAMPCAS